MFEPIKNPKKILQIMIISVMIILAVGLFFLFYQKLTNPYGFVSMNATSFLMFFVSIVSAIVIFTLKITVWGLGRRY